MSLGLVGAIATAPSSSHAAEPTDPMGAPVSDVEGNNVEGTPVEGTPVEAAPASEGDSMEPQGSMTPDYDVEAQRSLYKTNAVSPANYYVTERGGAIVAPGVNLSDYSGMDFGVSSRPTESLSSSADTTETSSDYMAGGMTSGTPMNDASGNNTPVDSSETERDGAVRVPESGTTQSIDTRSQSLGQVVSGNADFSTLDAAIKAAGLEGAFEGNEPITVFAPTNEAFAELPPEALRQLLLPENRQALRQILTYHVVQGNLTSNAIQPGDVNTAEGSDVSIANTSGTVTVSGATVTQADIVTRNGVIHAIDKVLLPPDLQLQ
ncbi:MAG: fasciclin domain-containing protein [Oscillatoriophycideae cyanobacterium NC_groundwater_1537_Pr4_S-0.65um_50_18]|nr:fasciclin domain-containing protein [Oscillatoriophycideae cyanobacterium NC_groundwater_1537_Pr4_S-0.65um_50_18]